MGEALAEELQTEVAFTIPLFGGIPVHESIVVMWGIMAFIMIVVLLLTRNLKIVPGRGQAMLESAVTWVNNFLEGNMGKAGRPYFAYLGTVLLLLGISNLIGMFGFGIKPPTKDINVTVAFALLSIILIEVSTFRAQGGLKGFLSSFTKPMAIMTPINIMEIGIRPLSLCMRLFGNVLGAFVIMEILNHVTKIFIPSIASLYFDFFDGILQAYVFVCLTGMYIKEATEIAE